MAAPTWLDKLSGQVLRIAGVDKSPTSKIWNLIGATAVYNAATKAWDITFSGGGGGGHVIEEEGTPLTQRANLNFVGVNVSVADSGGKTVVTIGAVDLATGVIGTLPFTRGGTGLGTLGTAGQSYRVNAGATAVEWYTPAAGLNPPANPADDGKIAVGSAANLSYVGGSAVGQCLRWTGSGAAWGALDVADSDAVTGKLPYANLADGTPCSVVAHAANSTGVNASVGSTTVGQILRIGTGPALAFGAIDLSLAATVGSSVLGLANGGDAPGITIAGATNANTTWHISDGNVLEITTNLITGGAKTYTWDYAGTPETGEVVYVYVRANQSSDLILADSTTGEIGRIVAGTKRKQPIQYNGAIWVALPKMRLS